MRKVIFLLFFLFFSINIAYAGYVKGYTKKDGTYISPYYRSNSNNTVQDNYSYKGNKNPHTGVTGSNYYRKDSSSGYYETITN